MVKAIDKPVATPGMEEELIIIEDLKVIMAGEVKDILDHTVAAVNSNKSPNSKKITEQKIYTNIKD